MPFAQAFDDAYHLAIKPACDRAGAYAERVDEQIFTGNILERVYNQISKADLLVADMSHHNANVFYEVGYAHALGKPTILITQSAEDIPFDLKHYPHVVYGQSLAELSNQLESRVRWLLDNPDRRQAPTNHLVVRVNGVGLENCPEVKIKFNKGSQGFLLKVEVQNRSERAISTEIFQIGLLMPIHFERAAPKDDSVTCKTIAVDGNTRLSLYDRAFQLYPQAWDSLELIPVSGSALQGGESSTMTLRVYRDSGAEDYPFTVLLQPSDA